jgi:hypothetical protein
MVGHAAIPAIPGGVVRYATLPLPELASSSGNAREYSDGEAICALET